MDMAWVNTARLNWRLDLLLHTKAESQSVTFKCQHRAMEQALSINQPAQEIESRQYSHKTASQRDH